nr:replication protein RepA [Azospirillum oleiclasticum]
MQPRLWVDTVRLSDAFFQALREHPVPVNEAALMQIANDSPALDVYIWLAYRLRSLTGPAPVSWAALHQQFGAGYKLLRQFRPKFTATLKEALAVYPEAKVTVDETGIVLHPSRPPIPERELTRIACPPALTGPAKPAGNRRRSPAPASGGSSGRAACVR